MKIEEMVCEHCGKIFYFEHHIGGYIDHYENFSSHKDYFGKDTEYDVREICYHGNDVRTDKDIMTRLNCYLQWDNIASEIKEEVLNRCCFLVKKIQTAKETAENIVKEMTMLERKYLIETAQNNCGTPFGNEDGKLWDGYKD